MVALVAFGSRWKWDFVLVLHFSEGEEDGDVKPQPQWEDHPYGLVQPLRNPKRCSKASRRWEAKLARVLVRILFVPLDTQAEDPDIRKFRGTSCASKAKVEESATYRLTPVICVVWLGQLQSAPNAVNHRANNGRRATMALLSGCFLLLRCLMGRNTKFHDGLGISIVLMANWLDILQCCCCGGRGARLLFFLCGRTTLLKLVRSKWMEGSWWEEVTTLNLVGTAGT